MSFLDRSFHFFSTFSLKHMAISQAWTLCRICFHFGMFKLQRFLPKNCSLLRWEGLCALMTLGAIQAETSVPNRFQVKDQTNTVPGPPGWGLSAGPTILPYKTKESCRNSDDKSFNLGQRRLPPEPPANNHVWSKPSSGSQKYDAKPPRTQRNNLYEHMECTHHEYNIENSQSWKGDGELQSGYLGLQGMKMDWLKTQGNIKWNHHPVLRTSR